LFSPKFTLSESLGDLLRPNENDFTFWLIFGLSPDLGLSELIQKVKRPVMIT